MVENAKAFVEKYMRGDASGHDYFHTLRVLHLAETIARQESVRNPVDMQTVQLIALLHDVDDRKLSPDTHENLDRAREFLRAQGAANEMTARILESIRNLSFGGTGANVPESLEGKIVQDADRLDAIGAIGIARAFAFGGSRGREMYDPSEPPQMDMDGEAYAKSKGHTINHFYEKLLRLKDLMNTETGKAMAQHRHGFMESFLEEFYGEWDGII
jgi:uncharacterized protein